MLPDILLNGWALAPPLALHEGFHQPVQERRSGGLGTHGSDTPGPPGAAVRMALSRFRARMCRFLAVSSLMPNSWAVSAVVSCSKCHRVRTSRIERAHLVEGFL